MSFRSIVLRHEESPWSWSPGNALRRRCIVTATDDQNRLHEAEIAPCPGVHPESLTEALEQWRDIESYLLQPWKPERWTWTRPAFGLLDLPPSLVRSVLTAVEQLLLSWMQRENPGEFSLPAPISMEGSALLALKQEASETWLEFLQLWNQGYRVIKCKVGRLQPEHEYDLLVRMTEHAEGRVQWRLDANRFMDPETIAFWKSRAHRLPIAYWEEAAGLEPLALDETLWDESESPQAAAWILKPTRLGLSRTVVLVKKADALKIPCVLSNAFDSGLSLRCSAWIYAAFCHDPQPLGFGTTRFLPADRWQSEAWGLARVTVPLRPFAEEGRE